MQAVCINENAAPKGGVFLRAGQLLLDQGVVAHLNHRTATHEEAGELGLDLGGDRASLIEVLVRGQQRAMAPFQEACSMVTWPGSPPERLATLLQTQYPEQWLGPTQRRGGDAVGDHLIRQQIERTIANNFGGEQREVALGDATDPD